MKRRSLWCCLALCVLWTLFIFSRSAKSGVQSSAESGAVLALVERLFGTLGLRWIPSERLLRKLGHFGEYFILGTLSLPAAKRFMKRTAPFLSGGYALLVALLDEFLVQNLAVGRGPSFSDVLIDTAGALSAILILSALAWIFGKKKNEF